MKYVAIASLSLACALLPATAFATLSEKPGASVSFTAIGPAGMQIVGTTSELRVEEDAQGNITITVPLGRLTTGIDLRDKHMREKYLEVPKYPNAVLKVQRSSLTLPAASQSGTFDTNGSMTLHGTTKPVRVRYTAKHDAGTSYAITSALTLDMTDYGIEKPGYRGLSVKTSVDLTVSFSADDK